MADPMDTPPADHGSDRYDYVELVAPPGIRPLGEWADRLMATSCPDCRANLFFEHQGGDPWLRESWRVAVAHDDDCPFLARLEGGGQHD